jgi:hypothetical protein
MAKYPVPYFKPEEFISQVESMGHTVHPYTPGGYAESVNSPDDGTTTPISTVVGFVTDRKEYQVSSVTSTFSYLGDDIEDTTRLFHERFFQSVNAISAMVGIERMQSVEDKEFTKAGPFVGASASEMSEKFLSYIGKDFDETDNMQDILHANAVRVGRELRTVLGSRPLLATIADTAVSLTKGTHFGAPYFTRNWGKDYNPECPDAYMAKLIHFAELFERNDEGAMEYIRRLPSTIFNRTVPDGRSILQAKKKRCTFAPSKYEAFISKRISSVVIDAFKLTEFGRGYAGDHIIAPVLQDAIQGADHVLSLDFSAFDQTAKDKARHYVRIALKELFDESVWDYIDRSMMIHDNPNLNTPFGMVSINPDSPFRLGLQSGLGLTGCYGTIWNRILNISMIQEMRKEGVRVENARHFAYGDDTLLAWSGDAISLADIETYLRRYGMDANREKQDMTSHDSRAGVLCQKHFFFYPANAEPECEVREYPDGSSVSYGIHSICRMAPRLVYKDVAGQSAYAKTIEGTEALDKVSMQIIETYSALDECRNHPGFVPLVYLVARIHPLHLSTYHIIDREMVARRDVTPSRGIEHSASFKLISALEASQGLHEVYSQTPKGMLDREIPYFVLKTIKFVRRWERSEQVHMVDEQITALLHGSPVRKNADQVMYKQYLGDSKVKPLEQRVYELEARKGVRLIPSQIRDLGAGRKIQWNPDQVIQMREFGNATPLQREAFAAQLTRPEIVDLEDPNPMLSDAYIEGKVREYYAGVPVVPCVEIPRSNVMGDIINAIGKPETWPNTFHKKELDAWFNLIRG